MPRAFPVLDASNFRLVRYYAGLAYLLTDKRSGLGVYLQGDDAVRFERELEAAERAFPRYSQDELACWLWDQCGYGDVAMPCD